MVRFIIAQDRNDRFRFAAQQGELAATLLKKHGRNSAELETVYVIKNYQQSSEELLSKSRAALFVLQNLGSIWRLTIVLRILPRFVLDWLYDLVARNRYRIWGKFDSCPMPQPSLEKKFLDRAE